MNSGSDRSDFFLYGTLTGGGGRVSIIGFRGLITSHLTRILNEWNKIIVSTYFIWSNLFGAILSRSSLVIAITLP